jgi:uncharacterized protein (DUF1499 family)
MQPIAWSGSSQSALDAIRAVLQELPRVKIVLESGNYLRAEAHSRVFRFVDDVEFLVDEKSQLIHFRSASRVGYSDFGANRARMERFQEEFRRQYSPAGP